MLSRIQDIASEEGGVRRLVAKALRRPGAALTASRAIWGASWPKLAFGSEAPWRALRAELAESGFLEDRLDALQTRFAAVDGVEIRGRPACPGHVRGLHAQVLYALIRRLRPAEVVETGVCNGLSSAVILQAMARNEAGRLHSIDLPEFTEPSRNQGPFWSGKGPAAVPGREAPGWLVPAALRGRWSLRIGRSQDRLAPLLAEIGPIDVFIHDSEHSYENQLFEFEAGFEALRPGGVLVATDITWSDAFRDFWRSARRRGARSAHVDANCALVRKAAR